MFGISKSLQRQGPKTYTLTDAQGQEQTVLIQDETPPVRVNILTLTKWGLTFALVFDLLMLAVIVLEYTYAMVAAVVATGDVTLPPLPFSLANEALLAIVSISGAAMGAILSNLDRLFAPEPLPEEKKPAMMPVADALRLAQMVQNGGGQDAMSQLQAMLARSQMGPQTGEGSTEAEEDEEEDE